MSQNDGSSKRTTIKIAAKDASQRSSANAGGADPGPGDPNAAPSVAPQLVDIPDPPTPSQLVVKSTSSNKEHSGAPPSQFTTLNEGRSGTSPSAGLMGSKHSTSKSHHSSAGPSHHSVSGSQAGPAASNPSNPGDAGLPREPTSSRPLSGPPGSAVSMGGGGGAVSRMASTPAAAAAIATGSAHEATASTAMQADSGAVHTEDEEGEGEVEQPEDGGTGTPTSPGGLGTRGSAMSGARSSNFKSTDGISGAPASSGGGQSKASTKTGGGRGNSQSQSQSPMGSETSGKSSPGDGKRKKKVTKFRYHKRITVRTSGKTSPSHIMEKVNKKDHKAALTPSTIEELDPQELMRRAGIKGSNKTHWRVRLRQTKRLTKNGKTTTQTKVAYRDSEGNKRVKSSSSPFCKHCGKKLEECKCDGRSDRGE